MDIQEIIRTQISTHPVVLYMKGTPTFPQCGFSAAAVQMLKNCSVTELFTVNVLEDSVIREGIKAFSDWPTVPQLYVNEEFIGGCDIMKEMFASGELQALFEK